MMLATQPVSPMRAVSRPNSFILETSWRPACCAAGEAGRGERFGVGEFDGDLTEGFEAVHEGGHAALHDDVGGFVVLANVEFGGGDGVGSLAGAGGGVGGRRGRFRRGRLGRGVGVL